MMRRGLFFLLLALSCWQASVAAAGDRLIAVIPRDSPPTYFQDARNGGKAAGFAVDVMDLLARRANFEMEYRFASDWSTIVAQVEKGEADVAPGMGISPERLVHLDFTEPVEVFPVVFFVRAGTNWSPEQAEKRQVGVVRGSVAYEYLKERPHLVLHDYSGFTDGLFDLLAGKIDAFACPQPTFLKLARDSGVEARIKVVGKPITEIKRAIAVRKGNVALLARLNQAVLGLTADAEYHRIYAKWYAVPQPYWTPARVGLLLGAALVLVVAGMLLWHYLSALRLNRELAESMGRLRAAEQELRLFRQLVDESRDAFFVIEAQSSLLLDVNTMVPRMLGYSREELLTMGVVDFETRLPDLASWQKHVAEVKEAGGSTVEGCVRRKDGRLVPVEVNVRHVAHGGREYMVAITRDITERKQAEAERERLLGEVKVLSGMLPICSSCKKIRDDQGYWTQVETYIHRHSQADFTHSLCPECLKRLYPGIHIPLPNGSNEPSAG